MKPFLLVLLILLAAASCGVDREAGRLYLGERELYRANWIYRNFAVRPQDVKESEWASLADRYERIGSAFSVPKGSGATSATQEQLQFLTARALFAAARIHGDLRDSVKVDAISEDMAVRFGDDPALTAEVSMARGSIAENRKRFAEAADSYESVIASVEPDPTQSGVPGAVLGLPLHVARLRAISGDPAEAAAAYDMADARYERIAAEHKGEVTQFDADAFRAEIAADRGDWAKGERILKILESDLRACEKPPRDPANVILARSELMTGSGADPESIRATLTMLVQDFPKSKIAPRALMALTGNANVRNRVEEALGYLDQIGQEYKDDEETVSEAIHIRAQLLESRDRWPEALETYRSLTKQHPLSNAALAAPLDIVDHYARSGDDAAATSASEDAERQYRDFIERYPPSRLTTVAREGLIRALVPQKKYDIAVTEMVKLGEDSAGSGRGANWFASAAAMAQNELSDPERAARILDRMSEVYEKTDAGTWASNRARQIREAAGP